MNKINKEIENLKRNQKEILELKSTVTEMKNPLEGFNSRCEEIISELEDKAIEIIKFEEEK